MRWSNGEERPTWQSKAAMKGVARRRGGQSKE